MRLSEAQKHLIIGLKIFGVEKDAIPGIVMSLPKPEQLDALMEWMCGVRAANTSEILGKVAEIVKATK